MTCTRKPRVFRSRSVTNYVESHLFALIAQLISKCLWSGWMELVVRGWRNVMRCAIWYHLYNVENTHGGVLILVKLHECFSHFLNCTNGTKSRNAITYGHFAQYSHRSNFYVVQISPTKAETLIINYYTSKIRLHFNHVWIFLHPTYLKTKFFKKKEKVSISLISSVETGLLTARIKMRNV